MKKTAVQRLDLSKIVPPNAISADMRYRIKPATKTVRLMRTETDVDPLYLTGPGGQISIEIQVPQTLFLEAEDGVEFNLFQTSYSF
jgi:hypothetical protein